MNRLAQFLNTVRLGQPQLYENMVVYPLHMQNGHERGYDTLDEAMTAKVIEVKEISEGGSVPTLSVRNTGTRPVLLVVGEELVGAKQNRVLNTSILVAAESETPIPVSCVEQGRWAYRSRAFSSSTTSSHFKLRKAQVENVTANLRMKAAAAPAPTSGELPSTRPDWYSANQGEVWSEVSRKISSTQSFSTTSALHDVYMQHEDSLKAYLQAFNAPDAEGLLVTINGQITGADLFDHHDTLRYLWPKLIRSYSLDAIEHKPETAPQAPAAPELDGFLKAAADSKDELYTSIGVGEDVRLSGDQITGSGLLWQGKLIHASLFNRKA